MRYIFILLIVGSISQAATSRKSSAYVNGWTLGAAVSYPITGRKYEFNGQRTTNGQRINAKFEFESQPSIDLFVKWTKENSLGFSIGYEMMPSSKLTGGSLTIGSTSYNPTTDVLLNKFSMNVIHLGTEYRWSAFYIPIEFALYLVPTFDIKSGGLGTCTGGGTSYRGGVGYYWYRHLFTELSYRDNLFSYCEILATGSNPPKDEYNKGHSKEINLVLGMVL